MSELYTFIAHRTLPYANPFSEATMQRCIDLLAELGLRRGADIADFGAGSCELPIRLVEAYGARVAAVELSARMAALAREKVHSRLVANKLEGGVTIHEGDAGAFRATIAPATYDLSICIGSSHALGGYAVALQTLRRITRPGGLVLVGEGFWAADPSAAYLAATGIDAAEFGGHAANIEAGVAEAMTPLWAITATQREWDEYEWSHHRNIEIFTRGGTDVESMRDLMARGRTWRQAFWRWGREVLGFGMYVFRV